MLGRLTNAPEAAGQEKVLINPPLQTPSPREQGGGTVRATGQELCGLAGAAHALDDPAHAL